MTAALPQSLAPHAAYTSEPLFPLTVKQYHELIRAGILSEADPVELLEGILVYKMPKNPPHRVCTGKVRRAIEPLLPFGFHYEPHDAVTLPDGEPEPDGAVIRGQIDDYAARHPGPDDVPLIIEVADSSLDRDRGIKLRSYARAGIVEYWIVNLIDRQVEVYTNPDAQAAGGPAYRQNAIYTSSGSVPLVIAGTRLADLRVSAMLP